MQGATMIIPASVSKHCPQELPNSLDRKRFLQIETVEPKTAMYIELFAIFYSSIVAR